MDDRAVYDDEVENGKPERMPGVPRDACHQEGQQLDEVLDFIEKLDFQGSCGWRRWIDLRLSWFSSKPNSKDDEVGNIRLIVELSNNNTREVGWL